MSERFVDRQSSAVLWTAGVLSVLGHAVVGVLLAVPMGFAEAGGGMVASRAELLTPPQVRLGEAQGSATAIAWLGYDEYRRHVAEPWTQDQAAFVPSAASAPGPLPPGSVPAPALAPMTPVEAEPALERVASEAGAEGAGEAASMAAFEATFDAAEVAAAMRMATERMRDLAASTIAAAGEAGRQVLPELPRAESALPDAPEAGEVAVPEMVGPPAPEPSAAVAEAAAGEAARLPTPLQDDAREESVEPTPRMVTGEPGSGRAGDVQDRESLAASIERATRVELGQPLAAAGLRIETRSPRHITPLTRATTRPRDPVVRIFFGADGRVREAVILRSSGHRNIDQPILDAVYEWRASGKPLADLDAGAENATLGVDFRIAL